MTAPNDLAALPKAELHIHLEGSIRPATLEEFCTREGVSISRTFTELNGFVEMYLRATQVMTRAGDYTRIVREYAEDAARAGVRYAELEVSPAIGPRALDSLIEAAEAASRERDVTLRLVLGLGRLMPDELQMPALDAIRDLPGFVGIGLGGPEEGFSNEPFADVFAEARRRGLRSAPHAGENAGPDSVRNAIDSLEPDRIHHGVRASEDAVLLGELAERGTHLAVCPTSNVLLGVVQALDEHPLRALWEAGISVSVNTDDPGFFDCDLLGEYEIAGRLIGLDREGYARLAENSIDGSFAPDDLKDELRLETREWARRG